MDLYATQNELAATCQKLQETSKICTEKEDMLCELGKQTNALLKTADEAVNDVQTLHDRLTKSRRILEHNYNTAEKFKISFCWNLNDMKNRTKEFLTKGIDEVENQIVADKKFVRFIIENQLALERLTNEIVKETSDQIQSTFDIITDQINSNECFFNGQLNVLKSAVDSQNQKAHEIISNLTEHALKMKTDWVIMLNVLENNKKLLEDQSNDIEQIQDRLSNLTKMTLSIPVIYNEKLKQREAAVKFYAEKCDFLEKEHLDVRKQIHEFGQALFKMAQNHMELLQRESECEEALRDIRHDKNCEERNFVGEFSETLTQNFTDINRHTEEIERINQRISQSATEGIKNFRDIYPFASNAGKAEEKCFMEIKDLVEKNSFELECYFTKLKELCEAENKKVVQYSESAEKKSNEIMKSIKNYSTEMDKNYGLQKKMIENTVQDNLVKKQMLASSIGSHLEELFSNIHDRIKEIETFFSEDIIKDEKTGNTPQRKEFNYPKRIVGFSFKNLEKSKRRSEADESQESVNSGVSDIDSVVVEDDQNKSNH